MTHISCNKLSIRRNMGNYYITIKEQWFSQALTRYKLIIINESKTFKFKEFGLRTFNEAMKEAIDIINDLEEEISVKS